MNKTLHIFTQDLSLCRTEMVSEIARELELRDDEEISPDARALLATGPFYRADDETLGKLYQALFGDERQLVKKTDGWYRRFRIELNEGHYFEALDRSHVLLSAYSDFVESHPAVQAHPHIRKQAEKALSAMMAVYQAVGAKMP